MDSFITTDTLQNVTRLEVEGRTFHLRRLSPMEVLDVQEAHFQPETIKRNPKASQLIELRRWSNFKLDVLTLSLCDEQGNSLYTIDQRKTVSRFDRAFYTKLVDAAHDFSYGDLSEAVDAKKN